MMTGSTQEYIRTSHELMAKAEDSLAQGDLLQASEKGWGAAAQMVKAVAERRGWHHNGNRELYQVVNRLAEESADRQLRVHFNSASALHSNFYEQWMPKEMVEESLVQAREFVQMMEGLL
ncbi:MAG: hypothetical protein FJ316_03025 [SAR202 cluster bacterium]|nr:hypothetical protein [SAR202 cluster bacterium]